MAQLWSVRRAGAWGLGAASEIVAGAKQTRLKRQAVVQAQTSEATAGKRWLPVIIVGAVVAVGVVAWAVSRRKAATR